MKIDSRVCVAIVLVGGALAPRGIARAAEPAAKHPAAGLKAAGAPLGLELYSLRAMMAHDIPAALARTRQMGFTDVEMMKFRGHSAGEVRRMLDDAGLTCSSMHVDYERLGGNLDSVVADAKALGATYVVVPWIPHVGPFAESVARTAAANFNRWGESLHKQGLHLCYHPHGYEFEPTGHGTLFDLMVAQTKKGILDFQLDVFWAWHGGQDPVALMRKYPDRFVSLHLKDMQKGIRTGVFTGELPKSTSVVFGRGQLDLPAILKEAAAIGIKESYIEDENEDASNQIPLSLEYLKSLAK